MMAVSHKLLASQTAFVLVISKAHKTKVDMVVGASLRKSNPTSPTSFFPTEIGFVLAITAHNSFEKWGRWHRACGPMWGKHLTLHGGTCMQNHWDLWFLANLQLGSNHFHCMGFHFRPEQQPNVCGWRIEPICCAIGAEIFVPAKQTPDDVFAKIMGLIPGVTILATLASNQSISFNAMGSFWECGCSSSCTPEKAESSSLTTSAGPLLEWRLQQLRTHPVDFPSISFNNTESFWEYGCSSSCTPVKAKSLSLTISAGPLFEQRLVTAAKASEKLLPKNTRNGVSWRR